MNDLYHSVPARRDPAPADTLAQTLGWFSIGLGVAELAADEYDMEAAGDEKGGVGVAQAVEGQLARRMKVGGLDGSAEGFADRGRSSVRAHAGSQRRSPRALCGDWQANAGATCSQVRVPGLPRAWRPRSLAGRAVGGG